MNLDTLVKRLGYMSYKKYLVSPHWADVKQRFFKSKLVKRNSLEILICTFCSRHDLPLHLHHKTYNSIGKEKLWQLVLVCELCHALIHSIADKQKLSIWTATKRAANLVAKQPQIQEAKSEIIVMPKHTRVNFGERTELRKMVNK